MAQDERTGIDFIDDFPFMLRYSKHSEPFFSNLLVAMSVLKGMKHSIDGVKRSKTASRKTTADCVRKD
jgi:hypothetical protein